MATEPAAARVTTRLRRDRQLALFRRASLRMPGGADSNFRAWGESTIYVDRGKGGLVWDADGNEFVDLRMGYGPVILGHGDPRVDDHVNERMRQGVSFSLTSEDEIRTIELLCELTGWVDMALMRLGLWVAGEYCSTPARGPRPVASWRRCCTRRACPRCSSRTTSRRPRCSATASG